MQIFRNKKSFALPEAITMVLAVVIIVFGILPFWDRAYAAFFGGSGGSLNNFDEKLVPRIQELTINNKKMDYREINYYLSIGDGNIVGFNKGAKSKQSLPFSSAVPIKKPDSCAEKACLCIFKPGETSLIQGKEQKCVVFDKITYLLKNPNLANTGAEIEYQGSLFYSSLPDVFAKDNYKYLIMALNVNEKIYIEKYTNANGEMTIYIAPINDDTRNEIINRKQYIDNGAVQ